MDRRLALVVALVCTGCFSEPHGIPWHLWIDDRFTAEEEAIIAKAIAHANETFDPLVGEPVFVYGGRYADRDGFTAEDLGDDRAVIYKVFPHDRDGWELACGQCFQDGTTQGWDILLWAVPFVDEFDRKAYRSMVLHELGHLLGLPHTSAQGAVMNENEFATEFTEPDIAAFCELYERQ